MLQEPVPSKLSTWRSWVLPSLLYVIKTLALCAVLQRNRYNIKQYMYTNYLNSLPSRLPCCHANAHASCFEEFNKRSEAFWSTCPLCWCGLKGGEIFTERETFQDVIARQRMRGFNELRRNHNIPYDQTPSLSVECQFFFVPPPT